MDADALRVQELGEAPADAELREEYQEMTSMVLKELLK